MVIHGGALVFLFLAVALARLGAAALTGPSVKRAGNRTQAAPPEVRQEVQEPRSLEEYVAAKYGII